MSLAPDPRPALDTREQDVAPLVAKPRQALPLWLLLGGLAVAGVLLFALLDAKRLSRQAPSVAPMTSDEAVDAPPPVLTLPPEPLAAPVATDVLPWSAATGPLPYRTMPGIRPSPSVSPSPPMPPRTMSYPPPPMPPAAYTPPPSSFTPTPSAPFQGGSSAPTPSRSVGSGAGGTSSVERVHAAMFVNPATTVPQGTLIAAVLETAFDSARAGYARAVVTRDVPSFDGGRVLIPRGSRLVGEYQSDATAGQKRALIIWNRLTRPDGATIDIRSPTTDPMGRTGIKADVDSHFFERFSGAILQSALNVGVNLASRSSDGTVVLAVPGAVQGLGQTAQQTSIAPTLKVKAATSINIFVARDLDFTEVERP